MGLKPICCWCVYWWWLSYKSVFFKHSLSIFTVAVTRLFSIVAVHFFLACFESWAELLCVLVTLISSIFSCPSCCLWMMRECVDRGFLRPKHGLQKLMFECIFYGDTCFYTEFLSTTTNIVTLLCWINIFMILFWFVILMNPIWLLGRCGGVSPSFHSDMNNGDEVLGLRCSLWTVSQEHTSKWWLGTSQGK